MPSTSYSIPVVRNASEYIGIIACWAVLLSLWSSGRVSAPSMTVLVVLTCWAKTALFGAENLRQLLEAAKTNLSHHRFMLLMGINMSQMILAFTFDFHLLQRINGASFSGVKPNIGDAEALFNFFYLSTLNFSFFGYSDILPQTVPAKLLNLTEIALAFVTVIFMLSDFISLKESLRTGPGDGDREVTPGT